MQVRTRDGFHVYAEAHGAGVPLVLSCALATTHENWRPQVEPLVAAGARVVLWDFIGHGRSDVDYRLILQPARFGQGLAATNFSG